MKAPDGSINITRNMHLFLQNYKNKYPETYSDINNYVFENVASHTEHCKHLLLKTGNKTKVLRSLYHAIDQIKVSENVTCKKGCNFCCHINVDISTVERDLILQEIITLESDQLNLFKSQIGVGENERSFNYSPCAFLKDGECSIYSVRPTMCRKHFAVTNPIDCNNDAKTKTKTEIQINVDVEIEIFVCVIFNLFGDLKPMQEQFLSLNYEK